MLIFGYVWCLTWSDAHEEYTHYYKNKPSHVLIFFINKEMLKSASNRLSWKIELMTQ